MKSFSDVLLEIGKLISTRSSIDKAFVLASDLTPNEQQKLKDSDFKVNFQSPFHQITNYSLSGCNKR
jgi:hypothetical protein